MAPMVSFTGLMIAVMSALFAALFVAAGYPGTGVVFACIGFAAVLVALAAVISMRIDRVSAEIRDRIR
jgi:hypothetical protein